MMTRSCLLMAIHMLILPFLSAFLRPASGLLTSPARVRPCYSILSALSSDESDDELEFMYETGFTKRKRGSGWKKTDNRDSLPFVVSSNTVDGKRSEIGTYLLDASTGCGDLLDLKGSIFLVQRVSYLYKYESGGFRVFKKKLDVTSTKTSWSDTPTEDNQRFLQ